MRSRAGARGLAKRLGNDADDGLFLLHLSPNPTLKNFSFLAAVRIRRKEADVAHTCKKKLLQQLPKTVPITFILSLCSVWKIPFKNSLSHCV